MKKSLLFLFTMFFLAAGYSQTSTQKTSSNKYVLINKSVHKKEKADKRTKQLRKKYAYFLQHSPFKKSLKLSKSERKSLGIPPDKYYEMEWELSMNPETGRPTIENLSFVKEQLEKSRQHNLSSRTPGDAADNNWVERGPTNVGGRTRAIMFDPNDTTNETVFAGSVSGGLWKNTNISNANSVWTRVNIPDNLNVSCITFDPNNLNIFYLGTGESYVAGDVNGNGVWKSIDGGNSWSKVFGGISGSTTFQYASSVTVNSPLTIAGVYQTIPSLFGAKITNAITSNVILVNDGTASTSDACEAITNISDVSGKIALIRRGGCPFIQKVKAAQDAGAIAVIMMNNASGTPFTMSGTDPTITIPSVMISKDNGDLLEATLASTIVNITLNSGNGFTGNLVPGNQHINDIKVRNNGGVSEVFVAAGDGFYHSANATTYLGGPAFGLYKSIDDGANWNEIDLPLTLNGRKHCPNNIEFGSNNKIWLSTTRSFVYGDGGGKVFSSVDGINFVQNYEVPKGERVQIAVSSTTPDKVYVLSELAQTTSPDIKVETSIIKTTNGFATTSILPLPIDGDNASRFTSYGFTGAQAFYNLVLELDPMNDEIVYAGGIDPFKSINGGTSWSQISHWYGGFGFQEMHADQHAVVFGNGTSSKILFGNDGGVYYSDNSGTVVAERNNGFNTTQFYSLGVSPTTNGLPGDNFIAGAQDNGSQMFLNATPGLNESQLAQGGDGAFSFFDQDGLDKYRIANYVYNCSIDLYDYATNTSRDINSESDSNGQFICPMALDSNLDLLYSDYSTNTSSPVYRIARYKNLKSGTVVRKILTNALLTSYPTAITVSKYTTATSTLLVGCRNNKLLRVTITNPSLDDSDPVTTWTDITGSGFLGSISDVEFGNSESEILVTMHNYNVVSIWYSDDAGATWQNKEGNFPDIPVKAILRNPLNKNEVIIGTELGVWFTNTFNTTSPTWNQSFNGMSNVKVTDLDLRNDNVVFASTYGRGVFSGLFTSDIFPSNNNLENSTRIKIYPNPSKGSINLNINKFVGKINLQLVDINGRTVFTEENIDFNLEKSINFNLISKGLYVLNVTSENLNYNQKIVIE